MTTQVSAITQSSEQEKLQTAQVLPIVGAHFIQDLYTACVAPLLPVFIEKFTLSLTQVGALTAALQIPAVLNPFIGYLADKVSLRYFVIFAPAVTATLIGLTGLAPGYFALIILLFTTGVSVAAFHAPAPAMVARASGKQVGLGMSLFMSGGATAYAVGPLLAVWAVSTWTLEGFWRTAILGWAASLILYWRLRDLSARTERPGSLRAILPQVVGFFLPLGLYSLFGTPLLECLSTYLPTYMMSEGSTLWAAGAMLSISMIAGVGGVLLSGPLSDRLGRRWVLLFAAVSSSLLMLAFLNVEDWLVIPVLFMLGFTSHSTTPVMLAMVQEHFPRNRAAANGLYMLIVFMLRPLGALLIGFLGDMLGLDAAFFWSAIISLFSVPVVLAIPAAKKTGS
ncbi:MAG: hypothetical protein A2W33_07910 [Chloroflexi bacterium RBG_16_52_11]|nr:MAG: hypothetical protein A2W33_07910 [Chloroflexi bacterium RBG_16_52_11]